MRPSGCAREAGDQPEDRSEPVVCAVDDTGDPAAGGAGASARDRESASDGPEGRRCRVRRVRSPAAHAEPATARARLCAAPPHRGSARAGGRCPRSPVGRSWISAGDVLPPSPPGARSGDRSAPRVPGDDARWKAGRLRSSGIWIPSSVIRCSSRLRCDRSTSASRFSTCGATGIGLAPRDQPIDDGRLDLIGPGVDQPPADIGPHRSKSVVHPVMGAQELPARSRSGWRSSGRLCRDSRRRSRRYS
jgi:hypothetical protein